MNPDNIDFFLIQADKIVREVYSHFARDFFESIEVRQFENQLKNDVAEDGLQASAFYTIIARDQLLDELEQSGKKAFISSAFSENGTVYFFVIHYNSSRSSLVSRYETFLDSLNETLFDFLIEELKNDNFYFYNSSLAKIILNRSVQDLVTEVSKKCSGYVDVALYENINLSLLDVLSDLAYQTYEKSNTNGLIYFTDSVLNAEFQFKFDNPDDFGNFSPDNLKLLRKLLQLTNSREKIGIICDTNRMYGIGKLKSGALNYSVTFDEDHLWVLCKSDKEIISMKDNNLLFMNSRISYTDFCAYVKNIFSESSEQNAEKLYGIIQSLIRQHEGTILVVMKDAQKYIDRYRDLAMAIEPVTLDAKNVERLSSIDGAILIDEQCTCYGFGVVLDGTDTGEGNRARGSRYNSSQRFYQWCRSQHDADIFLFVLSDDGNYNFFPEME